MQIYETIMQAKLWTDEELDALGARHRYDPSLIAEAKRQMEVLRELRATFELMDTHSFNEKPKSLMLENLTNALYDAFGKKVSLRHAAYLSAHTERGLSTGMTLLTCLA